MGAFSGFKVGSRLILTRDAGTHAKAGDEVEVVAVLDFQGVAEDGIRVRRVDPATGDLRGHSFEFIWECGARYFKSEEKIAERQEAGAVRP